MQSTKIREASFADLEDIISLLGRHNMEFADKTVAELRHIWADNPLLCGSSKPWPIGWVIQTGEKWIAGFIGNIPVAYQLNGRQVIAACMSSWVVDHAYRRYSSQLILRYLGQESADVLINPNTGSEVSYKFFTAFGAREVFKNDYNRILFWITDYRRFAASALRKMHIPFSNFFSLPVSALQFFAERGIGTEGVRCISSFDERFDVFWDGLKKDNNGFLCVRDTKTLNWHFNSAILRKKIWIFVIGESSRMTSYAVFLRQDSHQTGLRRMRLVDFQAIADAGSALKSMILHALRKCRNEGIAVLEVLGFNGNKSAALRQLGCRERRLACRHFFYRAKDAALARELQNSDLWQPCLFDSDASM